MTDQQPPQDPTLPSGRPADEATDTDVRGGDAVTADQAADTSYPPDHPLGVDDRNVDGTRDSLAEREARRLPEEGLDPGVDLVPPAGEEGGVDVEKTEIADAGRLDPDAPAEVAAVHVVDEAPDEAPGR